MKVHDVIQGSPEWDALRAKHRTGSEASVMMGASSHVTRSQLIHMKATGTEREFSDFVRKMVLDKGHEVEALARPIAEKIIGAELYPATISDDDNYMLVSLDGITMMDDIIWEHKQLNADKVAAIKEGRCPECDIWQVKQGLLVSGAEKCLYMVSDGTEENCHAVWVTLEEGDAAKLLASWRQFDADLAAYVPQEQKAAVVAAPVGALPTITYKLNGLALTSNIAEFKAAADLLIERSKAPLQTDQDFADRDALCKAFGEAEKRCELLRSQVLGEIKDVDEFSRGLGDIQAAFRAARLAGEKLVEAEKKNRRLAIQQGAEKAFAAHINSLNTRLARVRMPQVPADFTAQMKGKKSLSSMQDAVDTELARLKVQTSAIADGISANLTILDFLADEHDFLFADLQQIVTKHAEDFTNLVKGRIAEHKVKEEARLEAERERIRKEEAEKLASEQQSAATSPTQQQAAPVQTEVVTPVAMTSEQPTIGAPRSSVMSGKTAFVSTTATKRPSDEELVMLVAQHSGVSEDVAYGWLITFGKKSAA